MMVSIQDDIPYVLNGAMYEGNLIYYWEGNIANMMTSTRMPIFISHDYSNSEEQPDSKVELMFIDNTNGGGLSFRSDGLTLGNAGAAVTITVEQTEYANWWRPNSLLSAVSYTLYNNSGETARVLIENNGDSETIAANNIIMLHTYWYFNCTSTGKYSISSNPLDILTNWFCLINNDNAICTGRIFNSTGWTELEDCFDGFMYYYCPVGELCSSNQCKGPCPKITDSCVYNDSADFKCRFDPQQYFNETQWWTSPIFIITVLLSIGGVILLLGAAGLLFYKYKKEQEKKALKNKYLNITY